MSRGCSPCSQTAASPARPARHRGLPWARGAALPARHSPPTCQAELQSHYVRKMKQSTQRDVRGVGQGEIAPRCLLQCCGGCMLPRGCRELSNIPVPSLRPQLRDSSGQRATLKISGFLYLSLHEFSPNLMLLFPSLKI